MYDRRVKVFIAVSLSLLLVGVLRLAQMQLLASSSLQDEIAALKLQRGSPGSSTPFAARSSTDTATSWPPTALSSRSPSTTV
jgi:hypothetical protein